MNKAHIPEASLTQLLNSKHLVLDAAAQLSAKRQGEISCIFYNVYGWTAQCGPVPNRQLLQAELIHAYLPDMIAFQEYSTYYHNGFTDKLEAIGYQEVKPEGVDANYTPLFYRTDRLKVIDCGYLLYAGPNDVNSKSATWAVLELFDTRKRFIAISTHLMYNQPGIDANAARVSNAKELVSLISQLKNRPEFQTLPLITGGDLNCCLGSDPIQVLTDSGLKLAWETALEKNDVRGNHDYVTYHSDRQTYSGWSIRPGGYAKSIDHALVTDGFTVERFFTLTDLYAQVASDHMPEWVEISFNL